MAAYAAVTSLMNIINRVFSLRRISCDSPTAEIVQLLYVELQPLQETLKRLDGTNPGKSKKKVNALEERIKDTIWKFEDLLESHISKQIISQSETDVLQISIDLEALQNDVDSFIQIVKDMKQAYIYDLDNMHNMPQEEEEEDDSIWSRNGFLGIKSKMIGLSDYLAEAKDSLLQAKDKRNYAYSIVGMPGIGKTTLAKQIFQDLSNLKCFDHCAWVTLGRKSKFNQVALAILAQVDPNNVISEANDDDIRDYLKQKLEGKKCLIVLDDVWDVQVLAYLGNSLPNMYGGNIRLLLTTCLKSIAEFSSEMAGSSCWRWMRLLNEEESSDLLREKVLNENEFPHQIGSAARKIAKNCQGLPLMIVAVADSLLKAKNDDPELWNEVAERRNSVFMDAYDEISKVLLPMYDCLPHDIKLVLIYMGAFPLDYDIPTSKLHKMLIAEGFLPEDNLSYLINARLYEFGVWHNIVISKRKSMRAWSPLIKTLGLYSFWHHFLIREASKSKFLHLISCVDGYSEGVEVEGQRRLCIHSNNAVVHDCASTARSVLWFGLHHRHPVPLHVGGFRLLRVLDALKIRFASFPIGILNLVFLQYLALSCNGKLPTSISKLLNLQFLIIHPHTNEDPQDQVPVQIWDMTELKHIEILGSDLPNPNSAASSQKLATLLGVSIDSCSVEVLKKIPNIKKLGIQIELDDNDSSPSPLSFLDHILELEKLYTLKCVVVNPEVKCGFVGPPIPFSMAASGLRKLQLSGFGFSWKYMEVIGLLESLVVLKLRCYAFRGPKWETESDSFVSLEYLVIEDSDLVQWQSGSGSFPELRTLRMKNCSKLKEINWPSEICGSIELLDCNPLGVDCAKQLKPRNEYYDNDDKIWKTQLHVTVRYSLEDSS